MKTKWMIAVSFLCVLSMFTSQTAQAQKKYEKQKNSPMALPDLVVTSMEVLDSDAGKLRVTVMNKGKGRAETCELQLTVWDFNGKIYALTGMGQFPIEVKETRTVIFNLGKPVSSMKYELFTDYTKKITEANENNNIYKGYIGKY